MAGKPPPCLPHLPRCPYNNRYEALELDGQVNDDVDEGLSTLEGSLRESQPILCNMTTLITKEIGVVIGDSLPKGTKGPVYQPDATIRDNCCLPGAKVKDITRKVTSMVWPSGYFPLLFFCIASDEVAKRSPWANKRDFRSLEQLLRHTGSVFFYHSSSREQY